MKEGELEYFIKWSLYNNIGETDKLPWKSVGTESSQYIGGLDLELTNQTTRSPVYYLSVRARNGAGVVNSSPKISTPIIVVEEDKAGMYIYSYKRIYICLQYIDGYVTIKTFYKRIGHFYEHILITLFQALLWMVPIMWIGRR